MVDDTKLERTICTYNFQYVQLYFHMHTYTVVPPSKVLICGRSSSTKIWGVAVAQSGCLNGLTIPMQVSTPNLKLVGLSDQHTSLLC